MFDHFPRPTRDRLYGFHYFPDSDHYRQEDIRHWFPVLERLGASWLTLVAHPDEPITREFLQGLRDIGVEPIVEIAHHPNLRIEKQALLAQSQHYVNNGVRYISFLREPNVEANWSVSEWQRPRLVERVTKMLLPVMECFAETGLYPLLPSLYPGGEYWDTAFLTEMADLIQAQGSKTLHQRLGICLHHYAFNRPLSWGQGGQARWKDSRPYRTLGEDHRGWRLWEWYDDILRAKLGRSLPMISGATGAMLNRQDQADLPATNVDLHTERNLSLLHMVQQGEIPDYLLNVNFWLLAAEPSDPAYDQAWFRSDGSALPIVDRLQATLAGKRTPSVLAEAKNTPTTITHYLLLPKWDWGISSLHWEAVLPFVQATRATVGFDVNEAKRAHRVTVFIGAQGYDEQIVAQLQNAGCLVEAIPAPDLVTLKNNLHNKALR